MCSCAKSLQLCLTLSDPVDCSSPGSSVHGILQARILEWVAMPFSRGSSWPRDLTSLSLTSHALTGRFFITRATWEALNSKSALLCTIWNFISGGIISIWLYSLNPKKSPLGDFDPQPVFPSDRYLMLRKWGWRVAREKTPITPGGITDFGETATIIQDLEGNHWNTTEWGQGNPWDIFEEQEQQSWKRIKWWHLKLGYFFKPTVEESLHDSHRAWRGMDCVTQRELEMTSEDLVSWSSPL